jgi:hypothetical protein
LPVEKIVNEYEVGDSLRVLANRYEVGYGTIRRILAASRVPIRGTGRHSGDVKPSLIPSTYTSNFWEDPPNGNLAAHEVTRLRQAVGWDESWAGPYDAINGD